MNVVVQYHPEKIGSDGADTLQLISTSMDRMNNTNITDYRR